MINPREQIGLIDQQMFVLLAARENLDNLSPFSSVAPPSPFNGLTEDNAECHILSAASTIIFRKMKELTHDRNMWEKAMQGQETKNE